MFPSRPTVSSAHADFRCPAAIFPRLKTTCQTSVRGEDGSFRRLVRGASPSFQFVSGLSAYTYAPATNGGGIVNRLIRSRIAAKSSLGTATSASWKVTYFECRVILTRSDRCTTNGLRPSMATGGLSWNVPSYSRIPGTRDWLWWNPPILATPKLEPSVSWIIPISVEHDRQCLRFG